MFHDTFRNKSVWVSGHTGFKGAWLCEWLLMLGARVHGYALEPPTEPALFDQLGLAGRIDRHEIADVRDPGQVAASLSSSQPDFVFHLAAQSLVRESYRGPAATFATNTQGTVHVLEGLRVLETPCVAIMVTTDKVYENREWLHGYRECDPLGGHDAYSASKAAAEIAIASYRRSFFSGPGSGIRLASARAGNVIGGGDWAADRIVPDCFRALGKGEAIPVRNKTATRPWQHVVEPLSGYLELARTLAIEPDPVRVGALGEGMNFGPSLASNRTVAQLVGELLTHASGIWVDQSDPNARHEASKLNLVIDKAFHLLGWQPVWDFGRTVGMTASWYLDQQQGAEARSLCQSQIAEYTTAARAAGLPWAQQPKVTGE